MKKRLGKLAKMVRFGIKRDLVESGLMELPSLSQDKKRSLARSLYSSGICDTNKLARQDPKCLAQIVGISADFASNLIREAMQLS